jgi:glycosyltransferase involved in cell wall biosynthesis
MREGPTASATGVRTRFESRSIARPSDLFVRDAPLAVVTTTSAWDEPPRIRHQVARQLARFYNVLYVELPLTATQGVRWQRVADSLAVFRPDGPNAVLRRLRNNVAPFHRYYNNRLRRQIEGAISGIGAPAPVLVNFQFDFPEIMQSEAFRRKIYVCNDDFQTEQRPWQAGMYRRAEASVMRFADVGLAVSVPLVERLKSSMRDARLFLPGHEFSTPASRPRTAPLRERTPPIKVGYMGFINDRLRADWLEELVSERDIELHLIGPLERKESFVRVLGRPNVTHTGPLIGTELRERLEAFDVFVMPYDARHTGVRAISAPNKLFQYLACGRPVVCTDLPSLIELPRGFLYLAGDASAFVRAVRTAFAEDSEFSFEARVRFAADNTWDARGALLRGVVEEGAPDR